MSTPDEFLEQANVRGNVDAPILSYPSVRGTIRRHDPDPFHAAPFFAGLAGTSLTVATGLAGGSPTFTVINFITTSYADAVAAVNAAAPSLFQWLEADGFACIQGLAQGDSNFLIIYAGSAAAALGFAVYPSPGSVASVGDLASAPADKNQKNPQGTGLLAHGENITTQAVNRAILSMVLDPKQRLNDLDDEFVIHTLVLCTQFNSDNPADPSDTLVVPADSDLRISIKALQDLNGIIDRAVTILSSPNRLPIHNTNSSRVVAMDVTYGPSDQGASHGTSITWGVPGTGGSDGVFLGQGGVAQSLKVVATNITSISGSQIKAVGAQFVTKKVQINDHIRISSATNLVPFSHNGEYAVVQVIDEDTITVRPLGNNEDLVGGDGRPPWLNPVLSVGEVYGQVSVYVGWGIRATGPSGDPEDAIFIKTNGTFTTGQQALVRLPVVTTLRKMLATALLPQPRWDSDIALVDNANIFTKRNTFKEGVTVRSTTQNAGTPTPRIKADMDDGDTDVSYMLFSESLNANDVPIRVYQRQPATDLIITTNAVWNGTTGFWEQDEVGEPSLRYSFTKDGFKMHRLEAGESVSTDAWPQTILSLNSQDIRDLGLSPNPGILNARMETPTGGNFDTDTYSLIWRVKSADLGGGDIMYGRFYLHVATGELIITNNAEWDGTNWSKDVTGIPATKFTFAATIALHLRDGDAPWNDADYNPFGWDGRRGLSFYLQTTLRTGQKAVAGNMTIHGPIDHFKRTPGIGSNESIEPHERWGDAGETYRARIDHLGYPMDSTVSAFDWGWWKDVGAAQTTSPIIAFPEWKFVRAGAVATYTWNPPDSGYNTPYLSNDLSDTNGDDSWIITGGPFFRMNADTILAAEFDMMIPDPTANPNVWEFDIGFTSSTNGFRSGFTQGAYFNLQNNYADLNVVTKGTGGGGSTTELASVFGTWQRFRIEIHGSSSTQYNQAAAVFYVNNSFAGYLDAATVGLPNVTPAGVNLYFAYGANVVNGGGVTGKKIHVGNVRIMSNTMTLLF